MPARHILRRIVIPRVAATSARIAPQSLNLYATMPAQNQNTNDSKFSAHADNYAGQAQQVFGQAVGNESLAAAGRTKAELAEQDLKRDEQSGLQAKVMGTVNAVQGVIQETVGSWSGNSALESEGKTRKEHGQDKVSQQYRNARDNVQDGVSSHVYQQNDKTWKGEKNAANFQAAKGSAIEAVGHTVGSKDIQQRGQQERREGELQQGKAEAKGVVQGAVDATVGAAQHIIASVTGNEQGRREGEQLKAQGQQTIFKATNQQ